MTTPKSGKPKKEKRLHRHASPVIHVESDESTARRRWSRSTTRRPAFHPARHHVGTSIGAVPEVPNLSPGGSVTIKR